MNPTDGPDDANQQGMGAIVNTTFAQETIVETEMLTVVQARQTIAALMRYGLHTKQAIATIADADSAVGACALTLNFIDNVRTFVANIESADMCDPEIVRTGNTFLEHAGTQGVTAMSTEHEPDAIKGHLYMAVAIAERLLRSLQSDIVIRS